MPPNVSPWSSEFPEPVVVANGQVLRTLREARAYLLKLRALSYSPEAGDQWRHIDSLLVRAARTKSECDISRAARAFKKAFGQ